MKKLQLSVTDQTLDFMKTCADYEQYALVYSKKMTELQEAEDKKGTIIDEGKKQAGVKNNVVREEQLKRLDTIDRYVKICCKGKAIYRKCRAKSGIKANEIGLGDRTQKELGCDKQNQVDVCVNASSFISYYLHNSDRYIKVAAWITLAGSFFTIISAVIAILSLFKALPMFE